MDYTFLQTRSDGSLRTIKEYKLLKEEYLRALKEKEQDISIEYSKTEGM